MPQQIFCERLPIKESLNMNVGHICRRKVITVREIDDLTATARLMRAEHIGYVIVVEPDPAAQDAVKPVGVLTDRDIIVSVVARETDPRALRVGDVMTRQLVVAQENSSVGWAVREMRRMGVRRLPVVDLAGHLVGVLSLDNVLDALAAELLDVAGSIRNERRIESELRP
jgi:predicted transcriptional regulator